MSTPEERDRESRETEQDKYSEAGNEERRERSEIAERLREEDLREGEEDAS